MDYAPTGISNLSTDTEKKRLELIVQLISKRKRIRDITIGRLEELIVYCDNRILDIGDKYKIRGDPDAQRAAALWQKSIVDLERDKIFEQKELFRDTLFLRNEWVKSLLAYTEEKKIDELVESIERTNKNVKPW